MPRGTPLAKPANMPDAKTVRLVKKYDRPDFRTPKLRDEPAKLNVDIQILKMEMAELKDQRRRLRQEIEETIKMLTAALEDNKQETVDEVRRRISRLKGALEYRGRYDYMTER
jgi:FtsZ-binding cell division protein ZapB